MDAGVLLLDGVDDFLDHGDAVLGGAEHLNQRIDVQAAGSDVVLLGLGHQLVKHGQPLLCGLRNALGAQQSDALPGGVCNGGEDNINLVAFHGDGVNQAGLLAELHGLNTDVRVGAVDTDGSVGDLLNQVDHPVEGLHLVVLDGRTHIDKVSASFGLDLRQITDPVLVPLRDCLCNRGNRAVDLFTNQNHR